MQPVNSFWQDKVVWITGASSGIGEQLAIEASHRGAKLVLSARRVMELERVRNECCLPADRSLILPLDLEDYKSLAKAPAAVIERFGQVDILINNGGISQRSLVHETDIATYEKLMNVDFFGNIAISRAILPLMQARKFGRIVAISSVAGLIGVPLRSGYCAAKFALRGFYEALRAENAKHGICVTLVYPGFVKTQVSNNAVTGDGTKQGKMDEVIAAGIDPTYCAQKILSAVERGRIELTIAGSRERFAIFMHKHFPVAFSRSIGNVRVT